MCNFRNRFVQRYNNRVKSLKEALVDYNLAQLQSLAFKRGLTPPVTRNRSDLAAFADDLLSPASVAITVDDLSAAEKETLEKLIAAGGFLEARKFARLYGAVRAMGSEKLLREKPWESPVNPAEGLWYRGLIFKGFHHTAHGPEEIVFIPTDVQPLLPLDAPRNMPFQVTLASEPGHIIHTTNSAREDMFTLLVYLQNNFVRLTSQDTLPDKHRQAIVQQLSFPAQQTHWFDFVFHLARRMDFLRKQGKRLKLNKQTVKTWLQKSQWEQMAHLQATWRTDPTWNDLWHIPGLHPKPTGWENSPMLGRSKLLHYLAQLPTDEWILLHSFVQAIKQTDPDFQRPNGDYQSWYLYDAEGNPLMGFEHWDDVEGVFIGHLITVTLFALGVVDLGAPTAELPPTVFKLTPLGQAFTHPQTTAPRQKLAVPAAAHLRIAPADFSVRVSATASLYHRFQLARFASLQRRDPDGAVYQINRQSYCRALEQSITLEQILGFLNRVTGASVPLALVEALRRWDRRTGAVKLERLTVLRVAQEDMLPELINHPEIGPLLGMSLGGNALLVPEQNASKLRRLLVEHGYLDRE